MGWFAQALVTGMTAFVATSIDDIVILTLFFAQMNAGLRLHQIVIGQYLGFGLLIAASLSGFLGGLLIPKAWIGLLGLIPIAIGISQLVSRQEEETDEQMVSCEADPSRVLASLLAPQIYKVAAVTVANGGDNIGIYVPLFANSNLMSLGVILGVFLVMVGVWCYIGYQLSCRPAIALSLSATVMKPFHSY